NISANSLTVNRGTLSAETAKSDAAEGGANITLSNLEFLWMENESLISASALSNANGGNVTIDSTFIVATPPTGSEGSDIIANAVEGNGGRVDVTTQGLFGIQFRPRRTPKNDITVSSTFGLSGEYILHTPGIDPSRGLAQLPSNLIDAESQIDRTCTPGGAAQTSSFVVTGRGGMPPNPFDPLNTDAIVSEWVTLDSQRENINHANLNTNPSSTPPKPIVEAQGWVKTPDGQTILVAQASTVTPQNSWFTLPSCQALHSSANGNNSHP
ncbi:MAG: S-layer family protein, partial [Coleofasciculus sp. S288]|nr:S-layer family protein [Coleofasciculus sp. S288]